MTTYDLPTLRDLLVRVETATAPDRELDADIGHGIDLFITRPNAGWPDRKDYGRKEADGSITWPGHGFDQLVHEYTASIDAAVALVRRVLPGWFWQVAACHLSDDAWVAPDYNDPIHGERLERECPQSEVSDWTMITDVDRRPSGQPALALIEALLKALIAREDGRVQAE